MISQPNLWKFPKNIKKTHISVKYRDVDTKFELWMETEKTHQMFGQFSPIIKSKVVAAA
jgi:hypothetical protein